MSPNDRRGDESARHEALRNDRRERIRRSLPVVLLLLSLVVAGVGAFQAQRAHRSHRATVETLLTDYGAMAAWSFANRWQETVGMAVSSTLSNAYTAAVRQATTRQCLQTLLAVRSGTSCGCGDGLVSESTWAFHGTLRDDGFDVFYEGAQPPPGVRDRALARLAATARESASQGNRVFRLAWVSLDDDHPRLFALAVAQALSRDTVFYGVEADPERFLATIRTAAEHPDLLPASLTGGRANEDLLAIRVTAPDGRPLFESAPGSPLAFAGQQEMPATAGGAVVEASVLPGAADDLIIGGLPGNRAPLLLLIFGLAGALALLAIFQLRKDESFARERHDFVAGVSHELRTPLAQIRLFVETLRLGRTRTDEERDWALGNIDRETLRLTRLVENILHFSRSERGSRKELELEPAELAGEVEGVVASFEPLLRPRQADLVVDVPEGITVELHRDAFRQVILNLLDNAVKYGPAQQEVRVSARVSGHAVRLVVADEGPGIPPADREEVFDPFRRGREAVGSVTTGSGIGLSVVREIVRAHGGEVWVEDAGGEGADDPGPRGARLVVELPLLRTARPASVPAAADVRVATGAA